MEHPDSLSNLPSLIESQARSSRPWVSSYKPLSHPNAVSAPAILSVPGLRAIIQALQSCNLPGPAAVIGPKEYLGQGGQYIVHKATMIECGIGSVKHFPIAVKQPKFDFDTSERMSLAGNDAQHHLRNISVEIKALTTPALQQHANIVRLISWAFDGYNVHQPITLVVELAQWDLKQLLDKKNPETRLDLRQRYLFCSDVAAGLDAIHQCNIVHGDLKPGNVLVFSQGDRLVAKLADFGLAVGEMNNAKDRIQISGTPGWRAPEVESGQLLLPKELPSTDSYSLGLLTWSTVLGSGQVAPPSCRINTAQWVRIEIDAARNDNNDRDCRAIFTVIDTALVQLLQTDPSQRPHILEPIFGAPSVAELNKFRRPLRGNLSSQGPAAELGKQQFIADSQGAQASVPTAFAWEPSPGVLNMFSRTLWHQFWPEFATGHDLFTMFLDVTADETKPPISNTAGPSALELLRESAKKGFSAACAVLPDVNAFYAGTKTAGGLEEDWEKYLASAVATGAIGPRRRLEEAESLALSGALRNFRADGGYGQFYKVQPFSHQLHEIASHGIVGQLKPELLLGSTGDVVDMPTSEGESPLFLACARGSWDMAVELLRHGADAGRICNRFQITCLHWSFAFDSSVQSTAVESLVQNGGRIDAVVPCPVPFPHYPFCLPAGTPLHWATVTGSHTAVKALLMQGADPTLRDGSDPYRHDDRVRVLNPVDMLSEEPSSFSEIGTEGLSPLDYAAAEHDPFIFEFLLSSLKRVDINATDEEGFTVLHRLSTSPRRRTRLGCSFSFLPFRGASLSLEGQLERTIVAIKSLGGNFEQLTTPMSAKSQVKQLEGQDFRFESYTPLMLASVSARVGVVRSLLRAGAAAETQNPDGKNALHHALCCTVHDKDAMNDVVRLLLEAGASPTVARNDGVTPLQLAAQCRNMEAMNMLLSRGADLEDVDRNSRSMYRGSNVLIHFARKIPYSQNLFDEDDDLAVSGLLERELLAQEGVAEKRRRLVTHYAPGNFGGTLLYSFSRSLMRHTVKTLLKCGADANALSTEHGCRAEGGRMIKWKRQSTPLDAALRSGDKDEQDMVQSMKYTGDEYQHLRMRLGDVIKSIKEAGGTCSLVPEQIELDV